MQPSRMTLPNSRRLYIFITDGDVLLLMEEDNLSKDLRPADGGVDDWFLLLLLS